MALWGCYLLSFQTGIRGGHLYIFGEIVPFAGNVNFVLALMMNFYFIFFQIKLKYTSNLNLNATLFNLADDFHQRKLAPASESIVTQL